MKRCLFGLFFAVTLLSGCAYINMFTKPVAVEDLVIYVRTGQKYAAFLDSLEKTGELSHFDAIRKAAETYGYEDSFKPGKYRVNKGWNAVEAIKHLRSGNREPVKVSFHYVRTKEALAGKITAKLEADSAEFVRLLNDDAFTQEKLGTKPISAGMIFIPNTYEIHWNTSAEELCLRMKKEYDKFWNETRRDKAVALGLSPEEVTVLASLVQAEQGRVKSEWPIIAGLYLNRLNRGMLLQSDPTVVYAWGDFSIKRVLFRHLDIDSKYNTYKYAGLPPGPINFPEPEVIDAVLNADKNSYLYMCAKDDLSGRHNFAATLAEHDRNAAAYQRALNRAGIR